MFFWLPLQNLFQSIRDTCIAVSLLLHKLKSCLPVLHGLPLRALMMSLISISGASELSTTYFLYKQPPASPMRSIDWARIYCTSFFHLIKSTEIHCLTLRGSGSLAGTTISLGRSQLAALTGLSHCTGLTCKGVLMLLR